MATQACNKINGLYDIVAAYRLKSVKKGLCKYIPNDFIHRKRIEHIAVVPL